MSGAESSPIKTRIAMAFATNRKLRKHLKGNSEALERYAVALEQVRRARDQANDRRRKAQKANHGAALFRANMVINHQNQLLYELHHMLVVDGPDELTTEGFLLQWWYEDHERRTANKPWKKVAA